MVLLGWSGYYWMGIYLGYSQRYVLVVAIEGCCVLAHFKEALLASRRNEYARRIRRVPGHSHGTFACWLAVSQRDRISFQRDGSGNYP